MPTEETPKEETPTGETPAEKAPAEKASTEETPAGETPAEETPTEETPKEKMSFTKHLLELRKRIFVSAGIVFIGFIVSFYFSEHIFRVLTFPMYFDIIFKLSYPFFTLVDREGVVSTLVFLGPAEAFWAHMKIAIICGLIVTVPVLMYEFWRFISPGLLKREKRYFMPFMLISSGLFFIGSAFCFVIVLPIAMKFLLTYKTESLVPMISVGKYIDFSLKFILAFGVVFELPVVIVFLTRLGIVTPKGLARNRKYAVLLAFVAAAVLTPTPDAFNQVLMAVPIMVLYETGIIASRIFVRKGREVDTGKEPDSSNA